MKSLIIADKEIEVAPVLLDLTEKFGVSINYELLRFVCEIITYHNDNGTFQVIVRFLRPGRLGEKDREWAYASSVYLIESKAERLRNETAMMIEKFIANHKIRDWERRKKGWWSRVSELVGKYYRKLGRYLTDSSGQH